MMLSTCDTLYNALQTRPSNLWKAELHPLPRAVPKPVRVWNSVSRQVATASAMRKRYHWLPPIATCFELRNHPWTCRRQIHWAGSLMLSLYPQHPATLCKHNVCRNYRDTHNMSRNHVQNTPTEKSVKVNFMLQEHTKKTSKTMGRKRHVLIVPNVGNMWYVPMISLIVTHWDSIRLYRMRISHFSGQGAPVLLPRHCQTTSPPGSDHPCNVRSAALCEAKRRQGI